MSQKVFDAEDFTHLDKEVLEAFQEFGTSTLAVKRYKTGTTFDADFKFYTAEVEDTFQLHYTQFEYSSVKELGPDRADFTVLPIFYVWVPTREVVNTLPSGRFFRENDIISLGGKDYQIDNIIQIGLYHGRSLMQRLHLILRAGHEEDQ